MRAALQARILAILGRALCIRQVDAGSCNGCELEIHALNNAFYDLERFGLRFVASPRHADVLMVTGPVSKNMRQALERTYAATPDPKWVVAVGDCAVDGGIFAGSYAVVGGVSAVVPVDLHIRGCPPSPTALLRGLLSLVEVNLRKGGTTHPFLTLQFLTDGVYDPEKAVFVTPGGREKHFVATDHLESPGYRALSPDDLFDIAIRRGLHFNQTRETGVVFHMLASLAENGRMGIVAVGDSAAEADALYRLTQSVLDEEVSLALAPRELPAG